jgi:hypothetical protein
MRTGKSDDRANVPGRDSLCGGRVADTVYGENEDLRTWLEAHHYSYALAVACDEKVAIQTASGRKQMTVAEAEAQMLQSNDWQRLSMSEGTKGPRLYDWAVIPMLHQWEDDQRHFLLIRSPLDNPQKKTYYFVFAPLGTTLAEMVKAIGKRWHIEEDFETGKAMGLGDYEVRSFMAWYRHITLVMLVQACLAGICVAARIPATKAPPHEGGLLVCPVIPLTIPEVRHLLACLRLPSTSQRASAAFLVMVATLSSEPCPFLPYQTSLSSGIMLIWPLRFL